MKSTRRVTVIFLFLTTFAIAVTAIYVGIRLGKQPVTPSDTSALEDLPVCFVDTFSTGSLPDTTNWILQTNSQGIAIVNGGALMMYVPTIASTPITDRYTRLVSKKLHASDFIAEVDFTLIQRGADHNGPAENGLAAFSYPYDADSGNLLNLYRVEAYLTPRPGQTSELTIKGKIDSLTEEKKEYGDFSAPYVKVKITREKVDGPTDIVSIYYDVGNGEVLLMQTNAVDYIKAGQFAIETVSKDRFDTRNVYDNATFYCADIIASASISPTPTGIIIPTLVPGTCQCDLWNVVEENCTVPQVPICTGNFTCACMSASPTPTLPVTITPTATITPTVSITGTITPTVTNVVTPTATRTPVPTSTTVPTQITQPTSGTGTTVPTPSAVSPTLPSTALINEEADKTLVAITMIIAGFILYRYAAVRHAAKSKP